MVNYQRLRIITCFFIIFLAVLIFLFFLHRKNKNLTLSFSPTTYFHEQAPSVLFKTNQLFSQIYYTLDGSLPNPQAPTTFRYRQAIDLSSFNSTAKTNAIVIRAQAINQDKSSEVVTLTYFVGEKISDRFDLTVVSLVSDPINLYDHHFGIMIEGKTRADFIAQNPHLSIGGLEPANFNWRGKESERPVNITFFKNKELILQQNAAFRLHGFTARSEQQQSFRLTARKEYDPDHGKFKYNFFSRYHLQSNKNIPFTEFDSLLIRASNTNQENEFFRDSVGGYLAQLAQLNDYQPSLPAAIYINGQYNGLSWIKPAFNEKYLQTNYQAVDDNFQILELRETINGFEPEILTQFIIGETKQLSASESAILTEFNQLIKEGFRQPATLTKFSQFFDLDELIKYYAFQITIGNVDWPYNNMKIWRYLGQPQVNTPLDGRWHFFLYDFDKILTEAVNDDNIITRIFDAAALDNQSPLLIALIKNPTIKNKFFTQLYLYQQQLLSQEVISQAIQSYGEPIRKELTYGINEEKYYPEWLNQNFIIGRQEVLLTHAQTISDKITDFIKSNPDVEIDYQATFSANTREINPHITDDTLQLVAIHDDDKNDFLTLYNPTPNSINLENFCLSNNKKNLCLWSGIKTDLLPQETITLYSHKNKTLEAWRQPTFNFNLKKGETIFLSFQGEIITQITVPLLTQKQSFVLDLETKYYSITEKAMN